MANNVVPFKPRQPWESTIRTERIRGRDGTELHYWILGEGRKTLLLANGLGGRLFAWDPLIERFWRDYQIITWDYRGLFESGSPATHRKLSIPHHAEDALHILDAEGIDRAALVGWSMGVQVSLELAANEPHRIAGLVLLNGTYGHTLTTGFQPLFRVPGMARLLHEGLSHARKYPGQSTPIKALARTAEFLMNTAVFRFTAPGRQREMRETMKKYFDHVLGESFENYMRLFLELDAHSVFHLLPDLDMPAFIVSGAFDLLTPARQSFDMQWRMPNAQHRFLWRSSHFSLLERPDVLLSPIAQFLDERAQWKAPVAAAAQAG